MPPSGDGPPAFSGRTADSDGARPGRNADGDVAPVTDGGESPGDDARGDGETTATAGATAGPNEDATGERVEDPDRPRPVEGPAGREVVVPLRLYKTVTVVGTLLAMVGVIGGFVLLDEATDRGRAPPSEIELPVALAGLGLILAGALVYVYSTRFRAAGMGRSKAESDERPDDG